VTRGAALVPRAEVYTSVRGRSGVSTDTERRGCGQGSAATGGPRSGVWHQGREPESGRRRHEVARLGVCCGRWCAGQAEGSGCSGQ
jgi:hypothetical protein